MGKSSVRVIVRTRPTDLFSPSVKILEDGKTVHLHQAKHAGAGSGAGADFINNSNEDFMYKVDGVLRDVSQDTVFELAAADLVKSTIAGYNSTLMCYGQTGAGKTFTLMGGADYRTRGCVPRSVKALFDEVQTQADKTFVVSVSYLEIYNDRIRDLLNPNGDEDYQIQEDSKGSVSVRGVEVRACATESEALALLFEGNSNRQTAEHSLNANSSRSHAIFTMHVQSRSRVESESASIVSKLHCIDLAGSERLSKTGSEGKTAKEAQYINKSLTFLEQVVMALGSPNRSHVPFRQSKLTNLLKDSLGGNSKTTMIANVWPEERNFEETSSTLKFAVRMMRVQTDPTINAVLDNATHIKQLQRSIAELKAELQMQNQLAGKSHVQYDGEFGEDERFEMEKVAKAYVGGAAPSIPVKSLREVTEYFKILKGMIDQRDAEIRSGGGGVALGGTLGAQGAASRGGTAPQGANSSSTGLNAGGIGAVDKTSGFSVGVAAPSKGLREVLKAQPPAGGRSGDSNAYASVDRVGRAAAGDDNYVDRSSMGGAISAGGAGELPDKNTAFLEFKKSNAGAKLTSFIKTSQEDVLVKKRRITEVGTTINQLKQHIDASSAELQRLRNERLSRGDDDVVDEQEFQLVAAVKETKGQYRSLYDELTSLKDKRDMAVRSIDAAKRQLVEDYESWYRQQCEQLGGGGTISSHHNSPSKHQWTSGAAALDDDLDEGERFEALELHRVMDDDPESVAFYTAKKVATTRLNQQAPVGGGRGGPTVGGGANARARKH